MVSEVPGTWVLPWGTWSREYGGLPGTESMAGYREYGV